jgi:hypothetical protein
MIAVVQMTMASVSVFAADQVARLTSGSSAYAWAAFFY